MKKSITFITVLLLSLISQSIYAVQTFGCLIEPYQVAEVGTQVVGVIDTIKVERGDKVKKGQLIATLKSDVERASVGAANTRAKAIANVNAAKANYEFDIVRLERAKNLLKKNFISIQALDKIEAETKVSNQTYMQAIEQQKIAEEELAIASSQLSQRQIRSPFNGVITDRYMSTGERVDEKPIVRVAEINRLRVQVVVPVEYYGKIKVNDEISITPDFPEAPVLQGNISLIDKVIDAASNTFRVQLEIDNADLSLPAGLRCKADFGLEKPIKSE